MDAVGGRAELRGGTMRAFWIGLQFLTRIHLFRQTEWTEEDFGKSVSWFTVIGMVIGLILCGIYFLMRPLEAPYLTAFLLVAGEFLVTGAMHADGLMDTSDGLFSGRSRERMLEIMKDSCVGSFGLLAFVFLVLMKTMALAEAGGPLYLLLFAMPVIGRMNMVVSICEYPYARPYGIGKAFAAYRSRHAVLWALAAALLPALYFGPAYLILAGAGLLTGLGLNRWIVGKIGGTTGDTYGFVTEVSELMLALCFVVLCRGNVWFM